MKTITQVKSVLPPVQMLPRPLPPVTDETVDSFTGRLASANHLNHRDLVRTLAPSQRNPLQASGKAIRLDLLTGATGIHITHLAYALPEIRHQLPIHSASQFKGRTIAGRPNHIHPACRLCTNAKNISGHVPIWRRPDQNVCLRHGIWIGQGTVTADDQLRVSDLPEILQAQRRHNKLIRRYGHREVNYHYGHAHNIVDSSSHLPSLTKRSNRMLHFFEREKVERLSRSYSSAAMYPEAVTLTGVLISPYWRHFAVHGTYVEQEKFFQRIQLNDLMSGPPNLDRHLWRWIREHQPRSWEPQGEHRFLDRREYSRSPVTE
ncbi:TniQ family protein [Streptosporangium sp. DT93]|uniref:TniQ family protein n=1 Tax=Streptosporangium sp. DT93 TaxID=3393428 RepID=UPI003CF29652